MASGARLSWLQRCRLPACKPPGMKRLVRRNRRARTLNHSRCSHLDIFGAHFHRDRPRSSPRARCPRCRSSRSTATRAASRRCRRRSSCAGRPSRRATRPETCFFESDFAPTPRPLLSKAYMGNTPADAVTQARNDCECTNSLAHKELFRNATRPCPGVRSLSPGDSSPSTTTTTTPSSSSFALLLRRRLLAEYSPSTSSLPLE